MKSAQVVKEWQQKLSTAQSELQTFAAQLGKLALSGADSNLADRLTELRNAVTFAQAAVETAQSDAPDPRVVQTQTTLTRLEAEFAKCKEDLAHWGGIYKELEPQYNEAKAHMTHYTRVSMQLENNVMTYQAELNALLREQ